MNKEKELIKRLQNGSFRGIVFDFDGTILDVRELLERSIKEVLEEYGIATDMDTTIQEIGALLETIQGYSLPKVLLESYEIFKYITVLSDLSYFKKLRIAIKIFSKYLEYSKEAPLFPAVRPLLKRLKNKVDLFVVSHNKTETIIEHLKSKDIYDNFKGIFGSDIIPAQKPDPMALQPAIECYDTRRRDEFVMVGDMPSDIIAGREAGFWTVGIASGISKKEMLEEQDPDLLIDSLNDLLHLVQ
ncbi:MAG: HAD family hydrolase [Promethearchaeota archaeon]